MSISIPVSLGEVVDKITILQIKAERLSDAEKLKNVNNELAALTEALNCQVTPSDSLNVLVAKLKSVNAALWEIEDDIRDCEREKDFGPKFIELARSVYKRNDQRAATKKEINLLFGSSLVEEKSYAKYD